MDISKGIPVYCKCDECSEFFEVNFKRARICSAACRMRKYRREKAIKNNSC